MPESLSSAGIGGSSIWDVGADRLPAKWREFRGWPPVDVPMQMPVGPNEVAPGMTWPPQRLWIRNERLAMWRRVWRGDLTDFIGVLAPKARVSGYDDHWHMTEDIGQQSGAPMVINYARRYIELVSSLMMTVTPPDHLADPIQATIMHTMRDGKGYVIRRGTSIEAVEAMWCYETSPMWTPEAQEGQSTLYVVRPYISPYATWAQPDRVEIIAIGRGMAVTWHAQWSTVWEFGGIGAMVSPPVVTEGVWGSAINPPADFGWGQPAIQDLVPPMAGIALRYTSTDRVLAAHEAPTLMVPIPSQDVGNLLSVDLSTDMDVFGRKTAAEIVKRLRDNNVAWAPDGINSPEYLTWDGQLADSWMMIEHLKADVRSITGIPAAQEQEGGDVPSGTALAQILLFLWASTKQLHRQVNMAYQSVAGMFPWGNAFESAMLGTGGPLAPGGVGGSAAMLPGPARPALGPGQSPRQIGPGDA